MVQQNVSTQMAEAGLRLASLLAEAKTQHPDTPLEEINLSDVEVKVWDDASAAAAALRIRHADCARRHRRVAHHLSRGARAVRRLSARGLARGEYERCGAPFGYLLRHSVAGGHAARFQDQGQRRMVWAAAGRLPLPCRAARRNFIWTRRTITSSSLTRSARTSRIRTVCFELERSDQHQARVGQEPGLLGDFRQGYPCRERQCVAGTLRSRVLGLDLLCQLRQFGHHGHELQAAGRRLSLQSAGGFERRERLHADHRGFADLRLHEVSATTIRRCIPPARSSTSGRIRTES